MKNFLINYAGWIFILGAIIAIWCALFTLVTQAYKNSNRTTNDRVFYAFLLLVLFSLAGVVVCGVIGFISIHKHLPN